jgi:hypothetical protein
VVFQRVQYSRGFGGLVLLAGLSVELIGIGFSRQLSQESRLFVDILSLIIVWLAGLISLLFSVTVYPRAGA